MNEDRLIKIEQKIAYQELAIKNLNDELFEQQKEIKREHYLFLTNYRQ